MPFSTALASVDDDHFTAAVLEADGPVLVDFTAAWCPPCRVMTPLLEEIAAERPGVTVVQVDVEAAPRTAAANAVLSMPTFVLFRGGVPVLRLTGARPKRRLVRELDAVLS